MMNKIASDAYSQGAVQALSQLNFPGHIKQAAFSHLVKEAMLETGLLQNLEALAAQTPKSVVQAPTSLPTATQGLPQVTNPKAQLTMVDRLKALGGKLPKSLAGRSALGAGVLGLGGAAAYGLGAFDDDDFLSRAQEGDLSNAEIAALAGGTAALGAGGAYAAGLV